MIEIKIFRWILDEEFHPLAVVLFLLLFPFLLLGVGFRALCIALCRRVR